MQNNPIKTTSTPKPDGQDSSQSKLTREIIESRWNEVLAKVKQHNHSLSFILRVCQPRDINDNQLCLAFKYKFHKERINETNIKRLVENVLNEVYGETILIEAVIDETIAANNYANGNGNASAKPAPAPTATETKGEDKEENNEMIDQLLKSFGGKIVK